MTDELHKDFKEIDDYIDFSDYNVSHPIYDKKCWAS